MPNQSHHAPATGVAVLLQTAPRRNQPRRDPPIDRGTAVITGASSGIGEAFARHLAALGYDLILNARREGPLKALGASLHERHAIGAHTIAADLADVASLDRVLEQLGHHGAVTLLVNNAGFGTVGAFTEVDVRQHMSMIDVHVLASVRLTHAVLPGMLARSRAAIINVSSIGAFLPTPGNATYGATKACLLSFSRALAEEVRGAGVRVQALTPGFTRTAFYVAAAYAGFDPAHLPAQLFMTADRVVDRSLRTIESDRVVCIPGLRNRALIMLTQVPLFSRLLLRQYRHLAKLASSHGGLADPTDPARAAQVAAQAGSWLKGETR